MALLCKPVVFAVETVVTGTRVTTGRVDTCADTADVGPVTGHTVVNLAAFIDI